MPYIKLFATGDISLQTKNDRNPLENVRVILKSKDILFGNLETVLSESGSFVEKAALLFSNPKKVEYLKDAGFDVLNIANNHIMDLGAIGFHRTLTILRENELNFIGVNDNPNPKFHIQEKNGIRVGFSGYTDSGHVSTENSVWVNQIEEGVIVKDIKFLKEKCDFVIISLHWGTENVFYPSPEQIKLAHKLIDAGASVILGHHPHVIQGVERYKNGTVFYSLGNFQFDPQVSLTRHNFSVIAEIVFSKRKIEHFNALPIFINEGVPVPVTEKEFENKIQNFIAAISQPIINGQITRGWWFEQIAAVYLKNNFKSFLARIKKHGFEHFLLLVIWLASPFCINCYLGYIRTLFKRKK